MVERLDVNLFIWKQEGWCVDLLEKRSINTPTNDEMGSDQQNLLFHSEVHWLSHSEVLKRLYEL